jgi:hypothetical protein
MNRFPTGLKGILFGLAAALFCYIPFIILIYLDSNPFSFKRFLMGAPRGILWYLIGLGCVWTFRKLRQRRLRRYAEQIEERMRNAAIDPKES